MNFNNINILVLLLLAGIFCKVNAQNDLTNKVRISDNPLTIDNA
jgi:hypothetical protein